MVTLRHLLAAAALAPAMLLAQMPIQMPSRTFAAPAPAIPAFRAPFMKAADLVQLPALSAKAGATLDERGRLEVGVVRDLAQPAPIAQWSAVPGGFVARVRVSAEGAPGLRVKLSLGTVPGSFEARVQGDERIETMRIDPLEGNTAWTPWTEGATQLVELFSPVRPSADAIAVSAVVHFTDNPVTAKAAAACTISTMCSAGSDALDTAIAERKKSVMRLSFIDNGKSFVCTGTLINTDKAPAGYILTANHCIDTGITAGTLTTLWFYESADCAVSGGIANGRVQVPGGAQLVFSNHNVDSTLLLMNRTVPAGAVYSAWSTAALGQNVPIVSISHPDGDTARFALGNTTREYSIVDYPQEHMGVHYSRGIIEGGSSGSGLFTNTNNTLELRGILTGTTLRAGGLNCDNTDTEEGLYGRFEIFGPQLATYISNNAPAPDDAPNRFQDLAAVTGDTPLNERGSPLVISGKRIDYVGDVDVYRFTLSAQSAVTIASEGNLDVVGSLLDSQGSEIAMNDDIDPGVNRNFSITKTLAAGTYYLQVVPWASDATGIGTYGLRFTAGSATTGGTFDFSSANYTDLWWNASESGWGLNLNHQGDLMFGTLFTYDSAGPMWLVLARGEKQADGSYTGTLYRTTGPAFNASPWTATTPTEVGTLRVSFPSPTTGSLSYSYNGTTVVKSITRQPIGAASATCTWTSGDRSGATNYQDLWWNPNESGWGANVAMQGNVIFATLFTYDANGKGMWLVLPNAPLAGTRTYSGALYRTSGPLFSTNPWTTVTPTQVGTMTFTFANGNAGTLTYTVNGVSVTKSIQRQVFGSPLTQCSG